MDQETESKPEPKNFIFRVVDEYNIFIEALDQDSALRKLAAMSYKKKLKFLSSRQIKEDSGA